MKTRQVPWFERISYGLTDTGFNLIFILVGTYLMYFYTDVYGIAPGVIAPLLFIARILDAVTDPLEGVILDRIHTKWGKCRPFWLWFSVPFGLAAIATFSSPNFSTTGKIVFIYITYITLNLLVSLVALPMSAILPSLTSDTQERTICNVVRMVFNALGALISTATVMPLVSAFGKGDEKKGFLLTTILFAVISIAFFINGWANTKERVLPNEGKAVPVKEGIKSIKTLPWLLLLFIVILANLTLTIKNQSTIYYMEYNLNRPDLSSTMLTVTSLSILVATIFSPLFSKWMGKRNASLLGIVVFIIGSAVVAISGLNITLLFAGTVLSCAGLGLPAGLLGAMFADTVDYGEWKAGSRAPGIVYSASSVGIKIGQGLGGAVGAAIMAWGGYVPNEVQSAKSLAAIRIDYIWLVIATGVILGVLFFFYNVDRLYPQIQADLKARREADLSSQQSA